ncbi:hypothetical protein O1B11_003522 [Vibrio cholerae]|nr:hypothetical protein [Vibrio cholerae]HDL8933986.1 hypothetical protein [Vibrio cholerae]
MRVRELQEKLAELDPEIQVVFSTRDEDVLNGNEPFRLFQFQNATICEAEPIRGLYYRRYPSLEFTKSERSEKFAIIDITGEF